MMLVPIDTADKTFSIDPTGASVGALAANAWTGFDSPVQEIILESGQKYIAGKSSDPWSDTAFVTKASGRDQEISFKMSKTYQGFTVYLRYDGETAVRITVSKGGNIFYASFVRYVGRISQLKDVGSDTVVAGVLEPASLGLVLSGLVGTTFALTDEWTVGAEGDLFYAKFNGTTFWSQRFWTQAKPGKIALLFESNASVGYRDVTCTFKPSSGGYYSDFDNVVLDPRDWGLKDSVTTGSMAKDSYALVVEDASGFNVGDTVCVATGGEAGGGLFGTEGVGGTWPTYSFDNEAALPDPAVYRATNNPENRDVYVWLRSTSKVWIAYLANGVPTWGEFSPQTVDFYYYHNEVQPRALVAKITAKSGNTLTLDKAAAVATTNAGVFIDCTPAWTEMLAGNARIGAIAQSFGAVHPDWYSVREHVTIRIPPGRFALRKKCIIPETRYWTVHGESISSTVLHTPMGGSDFWVYHYGSHNTWHSMTREGNVLENRGFCHDIDRFYAFMDNTMTLGGNRQSGINGEEYCSMYNMRFYNTFSGPVMGLTHYSTIKNCHAVYNDGNLQRYTSWFFLNAYCIDSWIENCTYIGDRVGNAYEIFQADGGGMKNCSAINGYFSSNYSGGDYLWENVSAIIDLNYGPTRDWTQQNGAVFNLNQNIGGGAETPAVLLEGGRIVDPYIEITQRVSDGLVRSGIAINGGVTNCRVYGTHPEKPGRGVIIFHKTVPPLSTEYYGVRADSPAVIDGIRVINGNGGQDSRADIQNKDYGIAVTRNCVAESVYLNASNGSSWSNAMGTNGNITNAEYEALP